MNTTLGLHTPASVVPWLRSRALVPASAPVDSVELAGGISNIVIGVRWRGGALVVKQSLPELRVSELWEFDRSRIFNEARALTYLGSLLPDGEVPVVMCVDADSFTMVMSMAPRGAISWKERLRAGDLRVQTARLAGDRLGSIQRASSGDPAVKSAFADIGPLIQGRVQPYHRAAADRNPEVEELVFADVERLTTSRSTLVLGDYAPKNILETPDGIVILDLEVAHWGDPAFDVAFMLTHLTLKSLVLPDRADDLIRLAHEFWTAYTASAGDAAASDSAVVQEFGCLLLARADGKSPVEYLSANGDAVRSTAKRTLRGQAGTHPLEAVPSAIEFLRKGMS